MAAELRQVLCGQASETQEAWDQRPPFAFYPGEYPGETDRQYGRGVRPTIHDATIGTVFKGMYPTFQCSKSNYCFVIEGRFGDLDRSAKDPNYPLASLRPFEKATDGLSNEAVTALKKILAASSKK